MTAVKLYDTTLRDGMQGQGMSLSAAEKVRVVDALDAARGPVHRGRFPGLESERGRAVRPAGRRGARAGDDLRLRHDPPPRESKADQDEALELIAGTFAPVVTLVGKTWSLHLEKVTKVSREENLAMIGESIAFLRGEGKRVIYDAEHFFDAWRDDREYSLECLRTALEAGADQPRPLRHQRVQPARPGRAAVAEVRSRLVPGPNSVSTATTTPNAVSPTPSRPSTREYDRSRAPSTATANAAATRT